MTSLASLVEIDPRDDRPEEPLGTISISDIDTVSATVAAPAAAVGEHRSKGRLARPGDVLLARISPSLENGKVAIVPELAAGAALTGGDLFVLRPREGIDSRAVWAFLRQDRLRQELATFATGSGGYRRIDRTALERVEFPEQNQTTWEQTSAALRLIDDVAAARRDALGKLRALPGQAVANAVRGGAETELSQHAALRSGYAGRLRDSGERLVLRSPDLLDGSIVPTNSRFLTEDSTQAVPGLQGGDLLLTSAGSNPDSLGSAAVFDAENPDGGITFSSQLVRIRADGIDPYLLWALLQTPQARSFLLRHAVKRSARYGIAIGDLARLPLVQVPAASRVPLARLARLLRSLLALSRQQLGLLRTAVQAHLSHIFSGTRFLPAEPAGMRSPASSDIHAALQPLFAVASTAQRRVWEQAASQRTAFRVADLPGPAQDRSSTQHTISILEQLGVLIKDPEGAIESWRVPGPDEELAI